MSGFTGPCLSVNINKSRQSLKLSYGSKSNAGSRCLREEIQALRALAVLLVIFYHFWPDLVPGGFIGVDVFFVISGFLITSMLLQQIESRNRISLPSFWARRARRLLPAALLITVIGSTLTILFVPVTYWSQYLREIGASIIYLQNWNLAATSADYFAPHGPSPATHFWSLSVEGQFYLVWPLLLLVPAWVVGRRHERAVKQVLLIATLGTVTLLSFGYSIYEITNNPLLAYYSTPARAWEFGLGGLLALLSVYQHKRLRIVTAMSWIGLSMIIASAFLYSSRTTFPGWAALLPVIGTMAVIRAGIPRVSWGPGPLLKFAPVQFLGGISYSMYLWHWPLLILAPFVTGREITGTSAIAILAVTIVAAWITKLSVEDPVRRAPTLTKRHRHLTFATGALATGLVLLLTVGGSAYVSATIARDHRATERTLSNHPRCFGAASRDPQRKCRNPKLKSMVVPSPVEAPSLPNSPCTIIETQKRVRVCAFGVRPSKATATVAFIGDSHTSAFRPAYNYVAQKYKWRGLSITHSSCPFSRSVQDIPQPVRSTCVEWNRQVHQWLKKRPEIQTIFVLAHTGNKIVVRSGVDMYRAKEDDYIATWRALPKHVKQIFVVRDTPHMRGNTLACVQQALDRDKSPAQACAVPRSHALQPDAQATAAIRLSSPRVRLFDLSRMICNKRKCFPVIGGTLAFKDVGHLTTVFAATLGPYLHRMLDPILKK